MHGRIRRLIAATAAATALIRTGTALSDGTVVSGGPSGTTTDATPTFTFSGEPGAHFECQIAPAFAWKPGSPPMTARRTDCANLSPVPSNAGAGTREPNPPTRAFTVDTSAIDTAIDAGPEGLTNDPTPSFTFSTAASGATFECQIVGAGSSVPTYTGCSTPFTAPKLVSGAYTLKVRAQSTDGKLDSTPAARVFTVDADPPETTIAVGPLDGGKSTDRAPTFNSTSSEPGSTYECRLDNETKDKVDTVAWAPCGASWKLGELEGGQHTVEVRATDPAGNTDPTPAKRTWTVLVCDKTVRFGVIEAVGDCLSNFGTSAAPVWESTAPITVNGLKLPVVSGSKIVLKGPTPDHKGGILAVEDLTLSIAGVKLYSGGVFWGVPPGGRGAG